MAKPNYPWKRRGQVKWTISILVGTNHISGMAKPRVVKFYMQVGYVKSQHKDDKPLLKGVWSVSRDSLNYNRQCGLNDDICIDTTL